MLGLEILKVRPYVMNSVFVFPIHVIRGLKQKNMNPVQIVFFAVGNYSGRVRY